MRAIILVVCLCVIAGASTALALHIPGEMAPREVTLIALTLGGHGLFSAFFTICAMGSIPLARVMPLIWQSLAAVLAIDYIPGASTELVVGVLITGLIGALCGVILDGLESSARARATLS